MSNFVAPELKRSKYRILGLVGQGQFGRVYCARHRKTGQLVALKELDQYRFPTHKFLRELRFLLSLQHSNIVTCQALEHIPNGRYLVMDYCEGGTLRSLMEKNGQLHPAITLQLVMDVLAGIDHAHKRNIIHCDIKPENILLSLQPQGWTARISDFGISQLKQELQPEGIDATGSPAYMAPERFYGQYSLSSDLYAIGVLLFELLTGYRPFSGTPGALMSAHMNQPVQIPDHVHQPLKAIIFKALQKLQARRFQTAEEMVRALQAARSQCADLTWAKRSGLLLMQPLTLAAPRALKIVREECCQAAIAQLVPDRTTPSEERLYQVRGEQISCQIYRRALALLQSRAEFDILPLPEPVQELMVRPQGCFAVTERSVYLLSGESIRLATKLVADSPVMKQLSPLVKPQLIAQFGKKSLIAIDPRGRWIATATLDLATPPTVLNIRHLPELNLVHSPLCCPSTQLLKLIALDSRHLALLSQVSESASSDSRASSETETLLEIFTRRGNALTRTTLSVNLAQVIICPQPHRLVATEEEHSRSLLLIDLKPLKLTRIAVEITPAFVAATSWGLILGNSQGQILLLDRYGEAMGRLEGPSDPTAIVPFSDYELLIVTGKAGESRLYTVDLRSAVS